MSFPNDVQLCRSSIPGHELGVCSKEFMPAGTWIGPYEGKRIPKGMLQRETVASGFSWEVRSIGQLARVGQESDFDPGLKLSSSLKIIDTVLKVKYFSWFHSDERSSTQK